MEKKNFKNESVLIMTLGRNTNQLIGRRVREAHVYSEVVPYDIFAGTPFALKIRPGIIFYTATFRVQRTGCAPCAIRVFTVWASLSSVSATAHS